MGPFLVLLWLDAVFVSPAAATVLGAIYVVARAAYPLALGSRVGRSPRALVMASTVPGYLVLGALAALLVWRVVVGD
jgi:hypothetical protein